jgi:hypothetical protein
VHPTFKQCRNISECKFQSDCFFSHSPIPTGIVRCFECGEDFLTRNTMMVHRKKTHEVKICVKYQESKCEKSQDCWWKHETLKATNQHQGFWQAPTNLVPPVPPAQPPTSSWPQLPQNRIQNQMPHQITNQMPNQMKHQMIAMMLLTMEESLNQMRAFMTQLQFLT